MAAEERFDELRRALLLAPMGDEVLARIVVVDARSWFDAELCET